MARIEHGDAAREIDVTTPICVPEQRILRALDKNRVDHRNAARDGSLAPGNQ
jgi:hypothetical protein